MTAQDLYKKKIKALLVPFMEVNPVEYVSMRQLTAMLGCTALRDHGRPSDPTYVNDIETHEPLVRSTLLELLRYNMCMPSSREALIDQYSLFDGLAKNNRWRSCLQTPASCMDLISILTRVSSLLRVQDKADVMRNNFTPNVCAILNAWVKPETLFVEMPDADMLVRTLFGDAWCDIILGGNANYMLAHNLVVTIRSTCPPLCKGLLPGPAQTAVDLPALT
jgi:hypothetical protein